MNNIGLAPSAFANVVSPFNPVGRQAVSLENPDAKEELLAPVEQSQQGRSALNEDDNAQATVNSEERQALAEKDEQQRQAVEDQQLIRRLSARDQEVRAHEAAHASVGGQFAGSPSFTYQRGPDGVDYAIGGEVRISVPSGGSSPEATLQALQQVQAAALAPASPSEQDRQVAAQAASQAVELRAEIENNELEAKQQKLDEAEAEREEKAQEEARIEEQALEQQRQDEQRLAREQSTRRNALLGEELITLDNLERNNSQGNLLNQLA